MRVALFSDTWLPNVNGVARALGLLVEHAGRRGHEVALVTPGAGRPPADGVSLHVRLPGVPFPLYPELRAVRPWLGGRARARLRAFEPEVVHVATEAITGWLGRRWALDRGLPLLTSYCTNFAEYARGYGLGALEAPLWSLLRRFHGRSHVTLCPSHATLRELRGRGFAEPLRIWSRGVDADHFHPSRRDSAVRAAMAPGAEVVLLYVGRIAPEKRLDLLLEAWPPIREGARRPVALVFVGDGPALSGLRARGVDGVHFTGYRRGEHLAATYASADLFVFGSDTETFGQVVTEAFASGLPAVVPRRGGVADLVEDGRTGFLYPAGDAGGLARATLALVNDDGARTRMGAEARREAESRSWEEVFRGLFRCYEEALSARHPAVTAPRAAGAGSVRTLEVE